MLKLMKYEALRKQKLLFIAITIIVLVEALIIFTLYKGGAAIGLTLFLVFLLGFGGIIFILVDNINMYSQDLYKKQGYMFFLTPNNGYKILGSKVLIGLIELLVGALIYYGIMFLNYKIVINLYLNETSRKASELMDFFGAFFIDKMPPASDIFLVLLTIILGWFAFILTVYMAITLSKTLFKNIKFGGVISFVIFIVLNIIISIIQYKVLKINGGSGGMFIRANEMSYTLEEYSTISCIYNGILSIILFFFSGMLLNKKVDI